MMKKKYLLLTICALAVLVLFCLPAAHAGSTTDADSTDAGVTFMQMVDNGGWIMYVLAGMSMLMLALVFYFLIVLRVTQIAPMHLHGELIKKITAGEIDEARKACEYAHCPLSAVALVGIDYIRTVPKDNQMLLKDMMEGEVVRQAEHIQGQTRYLMDVGTISPMIGLLGTVLGMLHAFSGVIGNIESAKHVVLISGLSQALITTAFGLIVAIPAMMFYSIFRRKATSLVSYLDAAAADVLTVLSNRGNVDESSK